MKKIFFKKSFSLLLIVSMLLMLIACELIPLSNEDQNDEIINGENDHFDESPEFIGGSQGITDYFETVEGVFCGTDHNVFLKLKIEEIFDEIYVDSQKENFKLALVKCTVIEDYYGNIESGVEVIVKFYLNYSRMVIQEPKYLQIEELKQIMDPYDYIYLHSSMQNGSNFLNDQELNIYNGDAITVKNVLVDMVGLFDHRFIPLVDGKVNFDRLESDCWNFNIKTSDRSKVLNYDKYFYHGMTEEALLQSIEKLKNK